MRPMADCLVREFKSIGQRMCPRLDLEKQIDDFKGLMEFFMPLYLEAQNEGFDMVKNPRATSVSSDTLHILKIYHVLKT